MLKKNNYYLVKGQYRNMRIKIVHIINKYYGYIILETRDTQDYQEHIHYDDKIDIETTVLEDLGEHPDYSPDELPMNVFSNSTAE